MAKKNDGQLTNKQIGALRRWNKVCLGLAAIVVLSALACQGNSPDLAEASPHGFLYWFLLCMAYPALEILSLVNIVFGTHNGAMTELLIKNRSIIGLASINLVCTLIMWYLVRGYFFRKFGVAAVRIAINLVLMLLAWGILQLAFFAVYILWQNGGFQAMHEKRGKMTSPAAVESAAKPDTQKKDAAKMIPAATEEKAKNPVL